VIHNAQPRPAGRAPGPRHAPRTSRTVRAVTQTPPEQAAPPRSVRYKGEPLEASRGPGLGCFQFQLIVLAVLVILTPLSVAWRWPVWLSIALLLVVIVLLLVAGQTIIFLLRLVAADRRAGRRRPLNSRTPTVGELEEVEDLAHDPPDGEGSVRQ